MSTFTLDLRDALFRLSEASSIEEWNAARAVWRAAFEAVSGVAMTACIPRVDHPEAVKRANAVELVFWIALPRATGKAVSS